MRRSFGKSYRKLAIIYWVSGTPWLTLVHSSYADHLKFIENKSHKDSPKIPLKLELKEINQMVNIDAF